MTMLKVLIRAYHKNGSHLDIDVGDELMTTPGLFNILANSARAHVHLPNDVVKNFPSINELYHAFMHPQKDIVGLILFTDTLGIGQLVKARLYFDTREGRRVVFDNPYNMWLKKYAGFRSVEEASDEMSSDWHMGYFEEKKPRFNHSLTEEELKTLELEEEFCMYHEGTPEKFEKEVLTVFEPHCFFEKMSHSPKSKIDAIIDATKEFAPFKRRTIKGD